MNKKSCKGWTVAEPRVQVLVLHVTAPSCRGWQEHSEHKAALMSSEGSQAQAGVRQSAGSCSSSYIKASSTYNCRVLNVTDMRVYRRLVLGLVVKRLRK